MYDKHKTKKELIHEITLLKKRLNHLENISGVCRDIKSDLQKSTASLRKIADLLPDSMFEIDKKGTITFVNATALRVFGRSRSDIKKGLKCYDVFVKDDHAKLRRNISRILSGQQRLPTPYTALRKDGTKIPVIIHAVAIKKQRSNVGVRGVIVDITKVHRAHEMVQKAKQNLEAKVKRRSHKLKITTGKLERVLEETISALSSAIEKRDPYTAGHQQRVAKLAEAISRRLNLIPRRIKGVYMASLVHDLGKIYVPAEILNKPAKLSQIEINIIKMHATVGYEILNTVEFPWPIAKAILQHHERVDGSGYPQGLSGRKIIMEAKIIAVADVIEAMASHRPYRIALGIKKALEEITLNKGKLYDPRVVDACLKIFEEGKFSF